MNKVVQSAGSISMPTWIRFCLGSLWVGAMGLCVVNAALAASGVAATSNVESMPVGSAGQPTPNKSANTTSPNQSIGPTVNRSSLGTGKEYKLLPRMRVEAGGDTQSKGIAIESLQPFLRFALFMPEACFLELPRVTYAQDAHILSADRDLIYSTDVEGNVGDTVAIYRQGKRYVEPKTKEFLGYMAFKSAEAKILEKQDTEKKNNIVLQVKHNVEAIDKTMRITKSEWPPILSLHYLKPVLVENSVNGYIIDVWDPGVTLIGRNVVVVLSVGKRDGVSIGNLLEIYRSRDLLDSSVIKTGTKDRPEIRVGRVLVYQVDEKLSLGLVTELYEKIILFDKIRGEVLELDEDECAPKNLDAHVFDNTCCKDNADCAAENKNFGDLLESMTENNGENCIE